MTKQQSMIKAPQATVDRLALSQALANCSRIIERRNTIPILTYSRICSDGKQLFVTGTDLDMEFTQAIPCESDSQLRLCVDAFKTGNFVKGAKSDSVTIESPVDWESEIPPVLAFDKLTFKPPHLPVSDYPRMNKPNKATMDNFTMAGADLWEAIDSLLFAVSIEETRYYLNGIYMHATTGKELRFVATDGHKLARKSFPLPDGLPDDLEGVIVPLKTCKVMHAMIKGKACPDTVTINLSETMIQFVWAGGCVLTSKLVDGTFPDYQRVEAEPFNNPYLLEVDSNELLDACTAISKAADNPDHAIKFEIKSESMVLSVGSFDMGKAEMPVDCTFHKNLAEGETKDSVLFEGGFNGRYIAQVINAVSPNKDDSTLRFSLNDSGTPVVIKGDRADFIVILMPMRM